MFDFENSRSRSWPRSNLSWIDMFVFCFMAIGPFLTEIKQIPYLTLTIQGQGHNKNWPKYNQVIYRSGSLILPQMKEIWKVVQNLLHEQKSVASSSGVRTGTKTLSPPVYWGDLIINKRRKWPSRSRSRSINPHFDTSWTGTKQHWHPQLKTKSISATQT